MSTKKSVAIAFIIIGILSALYVGSVNENRVSYEKEWTFTSGELETLFIDNSSHDLHIEFVESTDSSNVVKIKGEIHEDIVDSISSATISNKKLSIPMKSKNRVQFFNFDMSPSVQHITVALTKETMLDAVQIHSTSGDGEFEKVRANYVELTASSGNVYVEDIVADEVVLETTSGNIEGNRIEANHRVNISASSGNLELQHVFSEKASLQTTSGKMEVNQITTNLQARASSGKIEIDGLDGVGEIKTTSGSIEISQMSPLSLDVEATSGNVSIHPAPDFNGTYDLRASSGNIKAPDSKNESDEVIKVRTTSGNIKIKE